MGLTKIDTEKGKKNIDYLESFIEIIFKILTPKERRKKKKEKEKPNGLCQRLDLRDSLYNKAHRFRTFLMKNY